MPKFENTNPIKDMSKLEEDLNTPRDHSTIREHRKIILSTEVIEEPELENLYDTGVFIPIQEKSIPLNQCYKQGKEKFRGFYEFPKTTI